MKVFLFTSLIILGNVLALAQEGNSQKIDLGMLRVEIPDAAHAGVVGQDSNPVPNDEPRNVQLYNQYLDDLSQSTKFKDMKPVFGLRLGKNFQKFSDVWKMNNYNFSPYVGVEQSAKEIEPGQIFDLFSKPAEIFDMAAPRHVE